MKWMPILHIWLEVTLHDENVVNTIRFCVKVVTTDKAVACERLLGSPKKIQMGPFNISKHLGRCVLFEPVTNYPLEQRYFKT